MSEVTAWVRNSLTEEVVCEVAVENYQKGWNEVTLASPITIDGTKDLYLGFSFQQSRSVKCLSFAGDSHENGAWIGRGDSWDDYSSRNLGSLSIEGVLEGDALPKLDAIILDMKLLNTEVEVDKELNFQATIKNNAFETIESLVFSYSLIDGSKTGQVEVKKTLEQRQQATVTFSVPTEGAAAGLANSVDITLLPNGKEDDGMADNTAHFTYATYNPGERFDHIVLMEEFTTENCVNCPDATKRIGEAFDQGYHGKIVMATHHEGYYSDWLTIPQDVEYCWFYNDGGSTYAPGAMLDRIPTGIDDSYSPIFSIPYSDGICSRFDQALARPAFVGIETSLQYDKESRQVTINVEAQCADVFKSQCPDPRITVFATIDSIKAQNQTGATGDYYHRHVTRAVLTGTWGDKFTWSDDNTFTATYTWTIPADMREDKFAAIAFIGQYDASDATNCPVFNTACAELAEETAEGIESVRMDQKNTETYYNMMGQKTDANAHGLVIRNGKVILK